MNGNSEKIHWVYGSEQGCDVFFMVGVEEPWRLPAHSSVLMTKNHVFRTMLSEPYVLKFPHTEIVPDVDGRAFDNLLRFLCNDEEPVSLHSVENTLLTLYASHKYQCPNLVCRCVDFLKDKINESNVIRILRYAQLLSCDYRNVQNTNKDNDSKISSVSSFKDMLLEPKDLNEFGNDFPIPSAPPLLETEDVLNDAIQQSSSFLLLPENVENIEGYCWSLLEECLSFVDKNAVTILASDEVEDLDIATLRLILLRDTLDVPNEIIVFNALLKWADKECKRKQLPLTPGSLRNVLKDSLYLPRYLTMNLSSFQCGPGKSDLFTTEELSTLTKFIKISTGLKCWAPILIDFPTLRPYLHEGPRHPIRPIVGSQPMSEKHKRFHLFKNFKGNKFCCKKNEIITPISSNNSSPIHSNNRINPSRNVNTSRRGSQSERFSRFNLVERIFICLACLFD